MPIVITPQGEYINSETGNPVNLPPQRPDLRVGSGSALTPEEIEILSRQRTGASLTPQEKNMYSQLYQKNMARENIPANMDMGMDSMMPEEGGMMTYMVDGRPVEMTKNQYDQAVRNGQITPDVNQASEEDVAKVRMLVDMGLPPADAMEAVAREKAMNPNPINPEAFSGGAVVGSDGMSGSAAGAVANVDTAIGGLGALPTARGSANMGMPENGMVADLMRRGYTPEMISAMAGGNMPPRQDDAMNLERTGAPAIAPMR
jgi:hypothetical protein